MSAPTDPCGNCQHGRIDHYSGAPYLGCVNRGCAHQGGCKGFVEPTAPLAGPPEAAWPCRWCGVPVWINRNGWIDGTHSTACASGTAHAVDPGSPLERVIFRDLDAAYAAHVAKASRELVEGDGTGAPLGLIGALAAPEVDPVEKVTDGRPALAWLLGKNNLDSYVPGGPSQYPYVGPESGECAECPFATPSIERDRWASAPNPSDPGEGDYDCSLLGREKIWGESPQCSRSDWMARARAELAAAPSQRSTRERVVRHLERTAAGISAAQWPWLLVEFRALISKVRYQSVRDPVQLDVEAMWSAIESAD